MAAASERRVCSFREPNPLVVEAADGATRPPVRRLPGIARQRYAGGLGIPQPDGRLRGFSLRHQVGQSREQDRNERLTGEAEPERAASHGKLTVDESSGASSLGERAGEAGEVIRGR